MFCLRNFLKRIGEYSEHRADTIQLLTGLARDSAIPADVRLECLDPLTTRAIFRYEQPDAHSDDVVRTFVDLLGHEERNVRIRMAHGLGRIGYYLLRSAPPTAEKRAYVDKITAALQNAIGRETDRIALLLMRESMDRLVEQVEVRMREEEDK